MGEDEVVMVGRKEVVPQVADEAVGVMGDSLAVAEVEKEETAAGWKEVRREEVRWEEVVDASVQTLARMAGR